MARKKRPLNEKTFKVAKTRDVAGAPLKDEEEDIRADSPTDALDVALQGDNTEYDSLSVKPDKGAGPGISKTGVGTKPKGLESVQYPYNLGLPMMYKALVEALTKKTLANLTIRERYGRLHITVPDAESMTALVEDLGKKSRGRTKVKTMAKEVFGGINESVKA